jgi:hypothetical protein
MKEIVAGLKTPDGLYSNGLHVAGERFVLTKAEDRSLYARKVSNLDWSFGDAFNAWMGLNYGKPVRLTFSHRERKVSSSSKLHKPSPTTTKTCSQEMPYKPSNSWPTISSAPATRSDKDTGIGSWWGVEENMFEGNKMCINVLGDHFLGIDRAGY